MGGISILTAKELSATYQPLLLVEIQFPNGTYFRVSTHPLSDGGYNTTPTSGSYQYGGHAWIPRVLNQDVGATQSMSDFGFDIPPQVQVVLADPDREVYGLEVANGFKGSVLKLYAIMWDSGNSLTGSFSTDIPMVKFIGTCSAATQIDQKTTTVVATSLLNMTQQSMPPVRIQPLCPWSFPPTAAARADGQANNDSQYTECGYSPDISGGVGNYESGTACFTFCDQSQAACVARLGDSSQPIPILQDTSARATGRFGGFDYVPVQNVGLTRPYVSGQWTLTINATNQARYGDYIPMAYGTTWIEPEIMGVYGDGNYTRFEALVCFNQCSEVLNVVVNGDVVPWYAGSNADGVVAPGYTTSAKDNFWAVINSGDRNGGSNGLIGWSSQGDCYGSTFGIAVQCLAQLASQSTLPQCQMLIRAGLVRVYTDVDTYTFQYSDNPAWILLDLLVKTNWRYSQVNIQSFIDAAAVCDEQIYFNALSSTLYANVYSESEFNITVWSDAEPHTMLYTYVQSPIHKRYSVGFSVKQRMPIGDLIRGVRNAMRGMLYFDFNTGLLTVGNKQTLADQQPAPIAGSNYNNPVASLRCATTELPTGPSYDSVTTSITVNIPANASIADGTTILIDGEEMTISSSVSYSPGSNMQILTVVRGVNGTTAVPHAASATVLFPANGYVAYSFDGSSIMKDSSGQSTLKISQRQSQETPNKVTNYFFDRENQYGQDISTIIDVEDVYRIGSEVTGSFALVGPQTFDHINRVTATWLAENYRGNPRLDYQGSAIGDTGGTLQFEFETSVKAIHLMVGQLCFISDAQCGIVKQLFRVTRIQPSTNFETAKISGYWHNDFWYTDDFGQGANQGVYVSPRSAGQGNPRPWRANYEAPQSGDAYHGASDLTFGVAQLYGTAADGTTLAQIEVTGQVPVNSFPDVPLPPQLEVVGVGDTGGGYSPGTAYFVGLSAMAPGGLGMSPMSKVSPVSLGPSQNALDVVVQGWPDAGSGYFAFAGLDPSSMTCQASSAVETSLVQLKNSYKESSWGPPDQSFSQFRISLRKETHAGVWGAQVAAVTSNSIKVAVFQNYGFATNEWAGREVSVLGIQTDDSGDPAYVPVANFLVASNTADTLVLAAGDPTTCVYGGALNVGDVVVMRMKPTFGSDSVGHYFEDLKFINALCPLLDEYVVVGATNTSPIVVSLNNDGTFPFVDGDVVVVQDVQGNGGANGKFVVAAVDDVNFTFQLTGSVGSGDYTGGGYVAKQDQGLVSNYEQGLVAFIIRGTGVGTSVKIASNTQTRYYIVGDWPVTPDATTRIVILDSVINFQPPSSQTNNSVPQLVESYLVDVLNYEKQIIFVQVSTLSVSGNVSPSSLDPFREIYLFGKTGSISGSPGITMQVDGTLAIGSDQAPIVALNASSTAVAVVACVKTAPTGAGLTVNINVGGFLWLSLTIAAGDTTARATPAQIAAAGAIAANSNVTLDIVAVGTTVPGSDLSVMIYM
jgi:hypothetical protein